MLGRKTGGRQRGTPNRSTQTVIDRMEELRRQGLRCDVIQILAEQEKRSSEQVRSALIKMLEPMARDADVHVLSAEVAYYDGDTASMAPVYRVLVRVHPHSARELEGGKTMSDLLIARYLGYGNTQLPAQLTPGSGPKPETAPTAKLPQRQPPPGDPLVGRYVVRNAESGFVDEANAFWNGLSFLFGPGPFVNSQYYWATPACTSVARIRSSTA